MLDPEQRLLLYGPEGLGDHELLAFLLTRGGAPGAAALLTARNVLHAAGGLASMASWAEPELLGVCGIGPSRARRIRVLAALSARLAERTLPRGAVVSDPRAVYESLRGRLGKSPEERFVVLLLDSKRRKLRDVEVARGSSNTVLVDPRAVFRPAVRESAAAVVLAHNHPSGDRRPSGHDVRLTEVLVDAGRTLGIPVLDHLVVVDGGFSSLAELGVVEGLGGVRPQGTEPGSHVSRTGSWSRLLDVRARGSIGR